MEFKDAYKHFVKHTVVPGWDYYLFDRGDSLSSKESSESVQQYINAANNCANEKIDNKTVFAYKTKYNIINKFRKCKLKTALNKAKWDFVSYSPERNRIYSFYPVENIKVAEGDIKLPADIEADISKLESLFRK